MKTISIAVLTAALAAAVAVAVIRPGTAHGTSEQTAGTITVEGTATARAVPDTATFTFGQETDGASAKSALAGNAAAMRRVISALLRTGVARDDIQTQDVSVYPRRNENGDVVGFSASGSVVATVRRLGKAGSVVDAAVAAGADADETSGPQFDRSSRGELTQKALREAFADARAKAEALAGEAGVSLGTVRRIEESAQMQQPVPMGAYADTLAKTPIEPGMQQTRATVTVTFSLA